jgi:hypothetical protein
MSLGTGKITGKNNREDFFAPGSDAALPDLD